METGTHIWMDGEYVEWDNAKVHIISHTFHYGDGVFEGIRFYETEKGAAVFRLEDHVKRLLYSANVLDMDVPYSEEELTQVMKDIIPKNQLKAGYIRPLIFYGYGKMGLKPTGAPVNTAIACWPWPAYMSDKKALTVKISKYIRIHPDSTVADAKISGHYVNSILATMDAEKSGFDEAIFLDYHGNIAEGPVQNLFMVKDNILISPKSDSILPGITKDSVMKIAKDLGYTVEERIVTPEEIKMADECFFCGTAIEVMPISKIGDAEIGKGEYPVTDSIREAYTACITGKNDQYSHWLTYI